MRSTADFLQIPIELGDRDYPVLIGENILDSLGERLRELDLRGRVAVISCPTVMDLYGERVQAALDGWDRPVLSLLMGESEEDKNLTTVTTLYDQLLEHRAERSSTIVALGGGLVGDTAGFVAATLLRGVNLIQVPTTILAQVDAAIGGKVGVNHASGKNLIGAIHQPRMVLTDIGTLQTLPDREVRSGLAEVIKFAVIQDPQLFEFIEQNLDNLIDLKTDALFKAISACCQIKAEVVQEDERELTGRRSLLNLGHTIGHALEALSGYEGFRHGEAVAIGMVAAAHMGTSLMGFPAEQFDRLIGLLKRTGFSMDISDLTDEAIMERTRLDKKVLDGRVRYVLPRLIGDVVLEPEVPEDSVLQALSFVRSLA
jgi:3-dehydroquinate synthase